MPKLKKMAYPVGSGEFIYVPKTIVNSLNRKVVILNQYVLGGVGGKLVIEYLSKKGRSKGVMELYDMGPDTPKKELKEEK